MKNKSLWRQTSSLPHHPPLDRDLDCDVAIIGGGITGLTAAYELSRAGRRVAVLELATLGAGSTGDTTGHLTASLDRSYELLISHFGESGARLAIESSLTAIDYIEHTAADLGTRCGFLRVPGFRFTEAPQEVSNLEAEARRARSLGLDASWIEETPLPFPVLGAIRFENQAQFHPLSYCAGLAAAALRQGGLIFEGTHVEGIEEGIGVVVHAGGHTVSAETAVLATHTPLERVLSLQTRLGPYTSYAMSFRLEGEVPTGLFWDTEQPYHYIRNARDRKGKVLVVGGNDHKSGQCSDTTQCFEALEAYTRERFPVKRVLHHWSGQVFEPADGLPYIGRVGGKKHIYTGTGYSGTGLTFGTVAGKLMSDLLLGRANPYAELFNPSRVKPIASAKDFLKENANVAWHWLADRLSHDDRAALGDVAPGQGRLLHVAGKQSAVYREPSGEVHVLSPVCTHAGCIVEWNAAAGSWDCPCHGGRFHPTGEAMSGPPIECLAARPLPLQQGGPPPATIEEGKSGEATTETPRYAPVESTAHPPGGH